MKRRIAIVVLLLVITAFALCACSSNSSGATVGNQASASSSQAVSFPSITAAELDIPYGDSTAHLDGLWAIESEVDYEYRLYIAADIDLSSLNDKERHFWDEDIDYDLYIDGGKNAIDFDSAYSMKDAVVGSHHYILFLYPFSSFTDARESFIGSDVIFTINANDDVVNAPRTHCTIDKFVTEKEFISHVKKLGFTSLD